MASGVAPTHNQPEYSVSEISGALKRVVEDTFGYVRVRGELSGFKRAASGHLYMDLKDDKAVLNGVCWRGKAAGLSFKPEDGLEVIVTGKISTYPGRSNYQIIIDHMEPAGEGALMALLEKRKKQMAAEGLFAAERKQPLPFMPQVIGVVTSPTGSVIRDILHRISERFPVHVLVWPVRVQGEGAAEEVAAAVNGFNALPDHLPTPDVLIVARGGGSLEDLWAFNEEVSVRAVANSALPVISAVGHETDTTIIDYVSDKRAPTPTAAAEIAVPVREEWLLTCQQYGQRLHQSMARKLRQEDERIQGLARGLPRPAQLLDYATQRLDDWSERLAGSLPLLLQRKQQQLQTAQAGLQPRTLAQRIGNYDSQIEQLAQRAGNASKRMVRDNALRLENLGKLMEALSHTNVLKRGFALVQGEAGLVTRAAQTSAGEAVQLVFHDGEQRATIGEASAATAKPASPRPSAKRKKSPPSDAGQESLF